MGKRATPITAACCGAAIALVLSALLFLLEYFHISSKLQEFIAFFALPLLVIIPGAVFVLGARFFPAESKETLIDSSGVGSPLDVFMRMLCWLAGGAIAGSLFYAIQRIIAP